MRRSPPAAEGKLPVLMLLLSGPNLNLLGEREPAVYGTATLADHVARATSHARALGLDVEHLQSNHEGELVDSVHRARGRADGIVINPGAFTHAPVVISNCQSCQGQNTTEPETKPSANGPARCAHLFSRA